MHYLKRSSHLADIIIVDDDSTDGTASYFIKKGFHVMTKGSARGLTHSWNIAYRYAVSMEYKYVIFCNNDALVSTGAIGTDDGYINIAHDSETKRLIVTKLQPSRRKDRPWGKIAAHGKAFIVS